MSTRLYHDTVISLMTSPRPPPPLLLLLVVVIAGDVTSTRSGRGDAVIASHGSDGELLAQLDQPMVGHTASSALAAASVVSTVTCTPSLTTNTTYTTIDGAALQH